MSELYLMKLKSRNKTLKNPLGPLRKCLFLAIAASAPCSNPHVLHIHSGSAHDASLLSQKKSYFQRHLFFNYLSLILLLFFSETVVADNSSHQARQLINQMSQATRLLNYDGIFVYSRGERMDTMRIIHQATEDGEHERLVSLTGYAREVIRDQQSVTCIFPDNQAVMVEKSRPRQLLSGQLPEPVEKIVEHYDFLVAGKERVAGRSTQVVNIVPKDDYRYGYQLWIDEEAHLLLKSELKDSKGKLLEQIMFTQIEIKDSIPDHLLEPAITGTGYTWYNNASDEAPVNSGNSHWKVTWMPNGFKMQDHEKQVTLTGTAPIDHMVYTDGLAIVSVFVEKLNNDLDVMKGPSNLGGVNAFATLANGYQITAVGEVPQETVQLMANSVIQNK